MTLKEFNKLVSEKTREEYIEWFEESAKYEIYIGEVYVQCYLLSKTRVAFRDGSIYNIRANDEIRTVDYTNNYKIKTDMIRVYDKLDPLNQLQIPKYLRLLEDKEEMEQKIKKFAELPRDQTYCSCCGKHIDEVVNEYNRYSRCQRYAFLRSINYFIA